MLACQLGRAQFVYTDADYSFDYTCNLYRGTLASSDYDYNQLFTTPVYATEQCMAVEDWFPGRSCYPQANRVTKLHVMATGIDDYTYYMVTTSNITRLGHHTNGVCQNYGTSSTLPQTINCGNSSGTDFSVGLTHSFLVCSTETHPTGTVVEKISGFGGVGGPGGFNFSFLRTVHPSLPLRFITSSGSMQTVTVYSYPGIAWLDTADNEAEKFNIYPNPSENYLTISNPHFDGSKSFVEVYDAFGRLIAKELLTEELQLTDMGKCNRGFYFLLIKDQNNHIRYAQKILKK